MPKIIATAKNNTDHLLHHKVTAAIQQCHELGGASKQKLWQCQIGLIFQIVNNWMNIILGRVSQIKNVGL